MKRCWVKIPSISLYHTSTSYHWVKGKLIAHHIENNRYEVKYKDSGPKVGSFLEEYYSETKPEELKTKRPEYMRRSIWPKTVFTFLYTFVAVLFFMSAYYNALPDWSQMLIMPSHWVFYLSMMNVIERIVKHEVLTEEIHKSLTEKE